MTAKDLRPIDEQIYDLLSSTSLTNAAIGKKLGIGASTVASRSKKMVEAYNMNPSIVRTSKKTKMYARYCQNIACHELCYFSATEIKSGPPFYCSEICEQGHSSDIISLEQIRSLYNKSPFNEVARELGISVGTLARLFEHYNIDPKEFPENVLVTPANIAQRQTQRIKQRRSTFSHTRSGFREHLGYTVRSSWENNFSLYLNHKKIKYEYEPQTFYFPEKTGARAYVPDYKMRIGRKTVWCEVKGRIESKDRVKMVRLKKHYPEIFNQMTYMVEKPGCKADNIYKKLGLEPFVYYNDLVQEFAHKLKHWEN